MKLIKTQIRNRNGQFSLSHLMKIAIEMPETLSDAELDAIITVWNGNINTVNCINFESMTTYL